MQVNASLANDIGNLLNRTLGLLAKNCGSTLSIAAATIPATHPLRELAEAQVRPPLPLSTPAYIGKTCWGCRTASTGGGGCAGAGGGQRV